LWKKDIKAGVYVLHPMGAVIENDIRAAEFLHQAVQEDWVGLISGPDEYLGFVELREALDVYRDDPRRGAEVVLPHSTRAALASANFEHRDGIPFKPGEMPLIYRKIMLIL
jgi:hypothetical protein